MDPPTPVEQAQPERILPNARIAWVFTVNNPSISKEELADDIGEECKYLIIGDEVGDQGTPHFQGYLELKKKKRFPQVKLLFLPLVPHLEARRGTAQQASDYCKKEGSFLELGSIQNQAGKRNDLENLTDMLVARQHMRDVALASPATWVRNYRGLAAFEQIIAPPPRPIKDEFELHLYYGRTGTGKTYKAIIENPGIFKKPVGKGLWFDGLTPEHTAILFDECNGNYALEHMLQITDKYECRVEVKGGHAFLDVPLIILTTNIHPATWYKDKDGVPYGGREENGRAFFRRFTKILFFVTRDDVREIDDKTHFWENPAEYQ